MRVLLVLFVICLCAAAVFAQTAHLPSRFQEWNEIQLIAPLTHGKDAKGKKIDKLTATFSGIVRLGRSSVDYVDNRASVTFDYRFSKYFSLATGVLYRREEAVKGAPHYETRLSIAAIFSKTFAKFTFRDRNQFEHRLRNNRNDINVYRQRIQISHPLTYHKKEWITPFISEEGYYDLTGKSWVLNEFYAGVTRKFNKRTAIDFGYIRNDTRPTNVNGVFVTLKVRLR